ncbi:MAG: biotin-dependent carboxyltransferase family protein [Synergistales bacterium]|nr:biotin-dependent carboxyltransferase family protein [Synergistales bacterium]
MRFHVVSPGLLTTVQDLGRKGYQAIGMPVAGAMDAWSFRAGNILAGNPENSPALEVTVLGPTLEVEGDGLAVLAGADLGLCRNGTPIPPWTAFALQEGDRLSFRGPQGQGARAYLCPAGGIAVESVMGSAATYLRASFGGYNGRTLARGDAVECGCPFPLWQRSLGFCCPEGLRPRFGESAELRVLQGPQYEAFTEAGKVTFFDSVFTVAEESDRMGYRLTGPEIEHREGADVISDPIPLGAVQVPGHGNPIVMLSDRQTTGGYTKIAVVCTADIPVVTQQLPGGEVRFRETTLEEAIEALQEQEEALEDLRRARAAFRSAPQPVGTGRTAATWKLTVDGRSYHVQWEETEDAQD